MALSAIVFTVSAKADVVEALTRFNHSVRESTMLTNANEFFRQLKEAEFLDTLYVYTSSTPADTLCELVWYWAAEYFYDRQQYEQARHYGRQSLALFKQGNDRTGESDCLNILSISCIRQSDFVEALEYAQQCYRLDKASGDAERIAASLNVIAAIYLSMDMPGDAEQYVLKGLQVATDADIPLRLAVLLGTASETYHAMGNNEQALDYAEKAYHLEVQLGREYKAMLRQSQRASALIGLHRYEQALELLDAAIPYFRALGDQQSQAICLNQRGMALLGLNRNAEAVPCFREAAAILHQIGDKYNEMHSRKGLYESLWDLQPDSARQELQRFNALRDTLFNHASAQSLARYQAEFGNDWLREENDAERAAKRRAIWAAVGIALALLLLTTAVWWLMRRRHRRQMAINKKLNEMIESLQAKYDELSVRYDHALQTKGNNDSHEDMASADREFLAKALSVIDDCWSKGQLDADTVASQMNMSLFQFRQRLTSVTGETPQAFITTVRMRRARHLLDYHPELNISEVAQQCAYNDTPNFTRAFKRTFGITPTQYQRSEK